MIFVEIGIAKDKHNCFVINSTGEIIFKLFTISNNIIYIHTKKYLIAFCIHILFPVESISTVLQKNCYLDKEVNLKPSIRLIFSRITL